VKEKEIHDLNLWLNHIHILTYLHVRTIRTYLITFTYLLNLLAYLLNRDHISKERKVITDTSVQIFYLVFNP